VKLNDSPIEFRVEHLGKGKGSIVIGDLIMRVSTKTDEPLILASEEAKHIFRAIKRTIDNKISEYVRQNPVNDGYTTLRTEEYADYVQLKIDRDIKRIIR